MQKLAEAPRSRSRKIAAKPATNAPVADLRDWLARVDALGELLRRSAPDAACRKATGCGRHREHVPSRDMRRHDVVLPIAIW